MKSVLQNIKDIEERNKVFHSLSDEDKRKEIAYDLYLLVKNEKVDGSEGMYWSNDLLNIKAKNKEEFQLKLNDSLPECSVCARGGMMLSRIRLGNTFSCNDPGRSGGNSTFHDANLVSFSLYSFRKMELEYECSEFSHPYEENSREKLMNICLNVINNGDFNELDTTNYLTETTL